MTELVTVLDSLAGLFFQYVTCAAGPFREMGSSYIQAHNTKRTEKGKGASEGLKQEAPVPSLTPPYKQHASPRDLVRQYTHPSKEDD